MVKIKSQNAVIIGLFSFLFCGVGYAQMTQTRLEHITGDRDHYTAKTTDKTVAIVTEQCLHKASDESGWYNANDGKPYMITFANGDTCKVLSFNEAKQE